MIQKGMIVKWSNTIILVTKVYPKVIYGLILWAPKSNMYPPGTIMPYLKNSCKILFNPYEKYN